MSLREFEFHRERLSSIERGVEFHREGVSSEEGNSVPTRTGIEYREEGGSSTLEGQLRSFAEETVALGVLVLGLQTIGQGVTVGNVLLAVWGWGWGGGEGVRVLGRGVGVPVSSFSKASSSASLAGIMRASL